MDSHFAHSAARRCLSLIVSSSWRRPNSPFLSFGSLPLPNLRSSTNAESPLSCQRHLGNFRGPHRWALKHQLWKTMRHYHFGNSSVLNGRRWRSSSACSRFLWYRPPVSAVGKKRGPWSNESLSARSASGHRRHQSCTCPDLHGSDWLCPSG